MTLQDVSLARDERQAGRLHQSAVAHMAARDIEAIVLSRPGDDPLAQRIWSSVFGKLPRVMLRGAAGLAGAALLAALVIMSRPLERKQDCIRFDDLAQTLRDAELRRADELADHPRQLCNKSFARWAVIVRQLLGN
jgi:hypothetical protein